MDNTEPEHIAETLYSEHAVTSGGARIVLSVWEPPSAPEAAIVFIPATMVHPLYYEPLLRGFAERGFAVVGLHPVGHGKSPRDVKRYTLRDIVQNGRDAVTFALERLRLPVIAMGSSQGGIVAAALAAEDGRIAAAFPHNVLLSELPDSITVSRFPRWLGSVYRPMQSALKLLAKLLPDLELSLGFYLDRARIGAEAEVWGPFERDPLCLKRYSLHFLASLFTTRFPGLTDGSVRCPLYIVADSGDRLFTPEYTQKVFERLCAPYKELIVFNTGGHMLMVTHPREVCDVLSAKMRVVAETRAGIIKSE
ncbi:MAG: alpha/beta hydrolase [Gracilibacteraceae bacterium]|jgi:alpha-beta hydrolase superfamily lysophospholipase|nr:alpha/beta hydrolase [Gracilibacteraceae bacterium]